MTLRARALPAASLLVASIARAAPEIAALEYRAPDDCPDASFFIAEVSSRTSMVTFGEGRAVDRSFRVVIDRTPDAYAGQLLIVGSAAGSSARTFEAPSCEGVVVALALVAALAVDPNASTTAESSAQLSAAVAPAPAAPAPVTPPPGRKPAPPPPRREPALRSPALDSGAASAAAPADSRSWVAGASGGVLTAITPVMFVAFGAFAGVDQRGRGLAPSLRLGAYYAKTGVTGGAADSAEFALLAGRLEACPLALTFADWTRIRACAALESGWLHAEGIAVAIPRKEDVFWASALLAARLEFDLSEWLTVEAAGGPAFPLTRPEFVFERPLSIVYAVPSVSAHAGFSIGARFQ